MSKKTKSKPPFSPLSELSRNMHLSQKLTSVSEENEELREANKHLQHLLDSEREHLEHLEKTTENLTDELLKATRKNTEDPKTFSNAENQVLLSLIDRYFDYNRDSLKGVYQFLDAGLGLVRDLVQVSAAQEKQQFDKQFELELRKLRLEENRFDHEVSRIEGDPLKIASDNVNKTFVSGAYSPEKMVKAWWKLAKAKNYGVANAPSPEHFETKNIKIAETNETAAISGKVDAPEVAAAKKAGRPTKS